MEENGSCQSTNTYGWGFYFLLLFLAVLLTALWALGMRVLWLDEYFESHYDCANRYMGIHRAAIDFASALVKDMGDELPTESVSEKELILRKTKALNGGKIPRLDAFSANGHENTGEPSSWAAEFRDWLKRRWWGRAPIKFKWQLIILLGTAVIAAIAMVLLLSLSLLN